jgi:SWI/SNF-related matrix-associated actin-dependent regulator of chromatin subfamily A3
MEPQWNPSLERQAIGRAVRLGQTKEVKVVRYITAVSIEEVSLVHTRLKNLILIFWKAYSASTRGKAPIVQNWI